MSLMSLAVAGKFFTAKSHSQWLRLLGSIWEYFLCMQISQYLNRDVLLHHPLFIFLAILDFCCSAWGGVALLSIAA